MIRPAHAAGIPAALLALVVGACSTASSALPIASRGSTERPASTSATTRPASTARPPGSAWERALAAIDATGHFSRDAALALFATAYGPLPGVAVQQDLTGVEDRTVAIDAVEEHRGELSPEQRAAIDAYLRPPAGSIAIRIKPVAETGTARLVEVSSAVQQAIKDVADESRRDIASLLGHDVLGDITVQFAPRPADAIPTLGRFPNAGTHATYAGGVYSGCVITIYDEATTQSGDVLSNLIAHETFHCFQRDGYRTLEAKQAAPAWVIEGQATWVGQTVGLPSPSYDPFWDVYLTTPSTPITARAHDALGFYTHLAESGIDPWSVFQAMWAAGSNNVEIFKAAHGDSPAFLDSWASGLTRQWLRGEEWMATGPGITTAAYQPPTVAIGDGVSVDLGAAYFSNAVTELLVSSQFLHLVVEGHGRLSDGNLNIATPGDAWFCVGSGECDPKCPDGEEPPPVVGNIEPDVLIATSGGLEGTVGTAAGVSLQDACKPPDGEHKAEFCGRYEDLLRWWRDHQSAELTQPWAAEIVRQSVEMRPFARPDLVQWVDVLISAYSRYAYMETPANVPAAGPPASKLKAAGEALDAYCQVERGPDGWIAG